MASDRSERTIPIFEEQLDVSKMEAITDRLRVSTTVEERTVLIEEVLERGDLRVDRVTVERPVEQAPAPQQDGDTLIVSIVEERLVIEKRLFVIEELRITRTSTTEQVAIPETLRTMRATVERVSDELSQGRDING